jgi:hypothetical protein
MCSLELSNGETLQVTPEHRFYSAGEWIAVEDLNVGDTLQTKENVFLVIENKAIIATFAEVFNLEIEGNENYYVTEDGLLVHNGYKGSEGSPKDAQKEVKKGIGPDDIKRIDAPEESVPGSQWHAHGFNGNESGSAINLDGTPHDPKRGLPNFSKKTLEWLMHHGWNIP